MLNQAPKRASIRRKLVILTGLFIFAALLWNFRANAQQDAPEALAQTKITPANTQDAGRALAASGETLVVGAPLDDAAGADAGAVLVYVRNGSQWTQQAKLTAADAQTDDRFGSALALDGDTLAVGARPANSGGLGQAAPRWAVYIFRRANGVWTQQTRIAPADFREQYTFGWSLSLSGNSLAVGGPFTTNAAGDAGAAFVYLSDGVSWTRQTRFSFAGQTFGHSVAIQGDTLVVGAPNLRGAVQPSGFIRIYTRSQSAWVLSQTFSPQNSVYPFDGVFGFSVAVSGNTVIAACSSNSSSEPISAQAVAYVYRLNNGVWEYNQRLDAAGSTNSFAFNYDSNRQPVAALNANYILLGHEFAEGPGEGYLFRPNSSNSAWLQHTRILPSDQPANTTFGAAAALANGRAFVGDPDTGSVYIYEALNSLVDPPAGVLTTSPDISLAGQPVTFTATFRDAAGNPLSGKAHFYVSRNGGNFLPYVGPVDLINGVATGTYGGNNSFAAGTYKIVAQYSGNQTFRAKFTNEASQLVEGAVVVSVNAFNLFVTEGNSGVTQARFTVKLDSPRTAVVSVNYQTRNGITAGAAVAGSDYQATSGRLIFSNGQTELTVDVPIIGDLVPERTEDFFLDLVSANGLIPGLGAQGLIRDNDAPTLSLTALTDDENSGFIGFDAVRLGTLDAPASVNYATVDSFSAAPCSLTEATPRCDYLPVSGKLEYAPNEFIKRVSIPVFNDMYDEAATKTVSVALNSPQGFQLANPNIAVELYDEDRENPAIDKWIIQAAPANDQEVIGFGAATLNAAGNALTFNNYQNIRPHPGALGFYGPAQPARPGAFIQTIAAPPVTISFAPASRGVLENGLFYLQQNAVPIVAPELRGQLQRNPLDDPRFFVRQNYLDFLNRPPDTAGAEFWQNQIIDICGVDTACIYRRRLDVSAAFFIEQEFQESGAFVYRLYKAAFGEAVSYRPSYPQFLPDRARVVGGASLNQGKLDFANDFVTRPAFLSRYPAAQTPAQFVDALLATIQAGAGVTFTAAERQSFINDVTANGRGAALKNLGDNAAFKAAVFNRAFVLMEYFGYLRRDPDQDGYDFWLNILNSNNPRRMVCAFVTSAEYQLRFSPVATRNDQNCPLL
jgi:hypothetical protein